jgi:hypothetical protein
MREFWYQSLFSESTFTQGAGTPAEWADAMQSSNATDIQAYLNGATLRWLAEEPSTLQTRLCTCPAPALGGEPARRFEQEHQLPSLAEPIQDNGQCSAGH